MTEYQFDLGEETRIHTIQRHITDQQALYPGASGTFSGLLRDLALAAKVVSREVRRAGLVDILGKAWHVNPSGDDVKKLDVFANEVMIRTLEYGGHLCAMASEEDEALIPIPDQYRHGNYIIIFDPLDGSSNIDANVTIGTIFSVFHRVTKDGPGTLEDALQPGFKQVAAGYVMYGSSTVLVYTAGHGTHGFTLDPTIGAFLLSHPDIHIPDHGSIYSVNEGNRAFWTEGMHRLVNYFQSNDTIIGKPYTQRYVGSLIADVHRTLLYGGIFMYPADKRAPNGKLRLLYEANPVAFIVEQAGGVATNGSQRVLDVTPTAIHQRTPLFLGSPKEMEIVKKLL
jgi:fructose-1,6-bisphosphatase I